MLGVLGPAGSPALQTADSVVEITASKLKLHQVKSRGTAPPSLSLSSFKVD